MTCNPTHVATVFGVTNPKSEITSTLDILCNGTKLDLGGIGHLNDHIPQLSYI